VIAIAGERLACEEMANVMQKQCMVTIGAALVLAGCGAAGSAPGAPAAGAIPLAAGIRVASNLRRCNPGRAHFCARELTLIWSHSPHPGATALQAAEGAALRRAGWSSGEGAATGELSAQSPNGALWLTYAPAGEELRALREDDITRAAPLVQTLRRDRAAGVPALSVLLEAGRS
jgi:hypothetical protein